MAFLDEIDVHLSRRSCRYILPTDLEFVAIVHAANAGTIALRFRRDRDTTLDFPVSAETLSDLIQSVGHLFGTPHPDLSEALQLYREQGGPVVGE
jgi:hypothetical protein